MGVWDCGSIINDIEVTGTDIRNLHTQLVTARAQFSVALRCVVIRMEDTSNIYSDIPFNVLTSPHHMNRMY
jgi:hypothetical protein